MIHIEEFMFATGIENSYPVITKDGHDFRRDEMRSCHHYDRWKEDFDLVGEMGIRYFTLWSADLQDLYWSVSVRLGICR